MLKVRLQVICNGAGQGEDSDSEESLKLSVSLWLRFPQALIPTPFFSDENTISKIHLTCVQVFARRFVE